MWDTFLSALGMLLCVAAVIGLAYWFTRHATKFGAPGGPRAAREGEGLRVLAQITLGREQRLAVIEAGGRYFLLGVTASAISTLAELTDEEAAVWRRKDGGGEGGRPPTFREAFLSQLGKKK